MQSVIYIVDDELHIRQLLLLGLSEQGFCVRAFETGNSFLQAVRRDMPDAVVVDWMMPAPDGAEICKQLRQNTRTRAIPVVMLTARGAENDRVRGLELGADDYVTKPFSLRELAARLRALLRRGEYLAEQAAVRGEWLRCGDVRLDTAGRQAFIEDSRVTLTMREYDLLHALVRNAGRVMTREMLLDTVWGMEYLGDTRTVDVHIRYLRQKLEASREVGIETMRGVGYRLVKQEGGG